MSKRKWFRSLYSRIVFGLIALLAVLLLAQGVLFLWLTGRFESRPQGQTAQHLADFVARELSGALTADPALDLDKFIRDELSDIRRPFLILMRDGRRASNRPNQLPRDFMTRPGGFGRGGGPGRVPAGGQPGVRPGSDPAQTGVKLGSDSPQTGVRLGSDSPQTGVRAGSEPSLSPVEPRSDPGLTPPPGPPGRG